MQECALRWKNLLLETGVDMAEVMPTSANPVVFASKVIDPSAPTVLVYGHYDVMPVEPLELWNTDPFEPVIQDGRCGRGGLTMIKVNRFCKSRHLRLLCGRSC